MVDRFREKLMAEKPKGRLGRMMNGMEQEAERDA